MGRTMKKPSEFSEEMIQAALDVELLSHPKYLIHNLYVFPWESDYLARTTAGYWYEVEIKISLSDFKADFKKEEKHHMLRNRGSKGHTPNYFFYCVPRPLLAKVRPLVPDYAGLIGVDEYRHLIIDKPAPLLHRVKTSDSDLNLVDKFYYNWKEEKFKNRDHDKIIRDLRYQISFLKDEYKAATGHSIYDVL